MNIWYKLSLISCWKIPISIYVKLCFQYVFMFVSCQHFRLRDCDDDDLPDHVADAVEKVSRVPNKNSRWTVIRCCSKIMCSNVLGLLETQNDWNINSKTPLAQIAKSRLLRAQASAVVRELKKAAAEWKASIASSFFGSCGFWSLMDHEIWSKILWWLAGCTASRIADSLIIVSA